ncbi:hypothetical protein [Roseospira goensis]|uniref:Uncharacterized protein n=1 Tax=Roseospira goensis TaxID=391922 RepID=A0A7W6RWR7_9PROT|nr:hypothetical protein [Roseospira goensis]MBB4284501.1 hypothetical protein [Roseospira goensis]
MTAPAAHPPPARPPFEAAVVIRLPGQAPGRALRGRLKTARELRGGRQVWAVRVPTPHARHPEGELVSLIVERTDAGWCAVGGEALGHAIRIAEAIAAGAEVREPVGVQLMAVTAGLLALVQPEPGP